MHVHIVNLKTWVNYKHRYTHIINSGIWFSSNLVKITVKQNIVFVANFVSFILKDFVSVIHETNNAMAKRKRTKGQTTIFQNTTQKAKDLAERTQLKLGCTQVLWRNCSFYSTIDTRHVILATNPVINH